MRHWYKMTGGLGWRCHCNQGCRTVWEGCVSPAPLNSLQKWTQVNRSLWSSVISVTTAESGLDKGARTHWNQWGDSSEYRSSSKEDISTQISQGNESFVDQQSQKDSLPVPTHADPFVNQCSLVVWMHQLPNGISRSKSSTNSFALLLFL